MARRTHDATLRDYLREIGRYKLLNRDEEHELGHRIQQGDEQAKEDMILANLRLVVNIAREFANRGLDMMDLIEEGNLGLLHAVTRFDPERDVRFSTYGTWWIRRAIRRALNSSARTIRIPTYMVEIIAHAKRAQTILRTELDREPTMDEVAERMDMDSSHARLVERLLASETNSLYENPTGGSTPGVTLAGVLQDVNVAAPDELVFDQMQLETLSGLMGTITDREAEILSLRFGLHHERAMTLREVGKKVKLSRERVRQLEKRALEKLKTAMEKAGFDGTEDVPAH